MMDSYTILAEYYDRLTTDVPYRKWADYIVRHFTRQKLPVHTVAELGCGTGSLAAILAKKGYSITAVDLSPEMLTAAADKCAGLDVTLVCQDMSKLALPQPADAVICCLDSLNYVTRPAAVRRTFKRVHDALKPGGLFSSTSRPLWRWRGPTARSIWMRTTSSTASGGGSINPSAASAATASTCLPFRRTAAGTGAANITRSTPTPWMSWPGGWRRWASDTSGSTGSCA